MLLVLGVISLLLFGGGMLAFFLQRDDSICPNGKPPVAQRSAILEGTQYRCSDGVVVTKG
ncbi:MAG TPA: hypothetical protein VFW85_02535 [Gaiellaceae bacterium]|nr:hypothetical protein [Gaiellaceae bacterium]